MFRWLESQWSLRGGLRPTWRTRSMAARRSTYWRGRRCKAAPISCRPAYLQEPEAGSFSGGSGGAAYPYPEQGPINLPPPKGGKGGGRGRGRGKPVLQGEPDEEEE